MNCWEFIKCEKEVRDTCPSYPKRGLDCWKITGTKCGKGAVEKATANEKIEYCRKCDFYIQYANKF